VNLLGHCLFLLPVTATIFWLSLPYVSASWRILEGSPEVGGIPGVFLLKTLIPLTSTLLFLQGLVGIQRAVDVIRGGRMEPNT
jgi:TRAP-type mannitol/chloroaromatic compound transport system permease small subunit